MRKKLAWYFFLNATIFMITGCGPVHNQIRLPSTSDIEISSINLVVPAEGEFTVFYERATATAAPAAMFGLVGAAVAAAANNSADRKVTDSLITHLSETSCAPEFKSSFLATVAESSEIQVYSEDMVNPQNSAVDATIHFDIESCGFRVVESGRMLIAPFIEMYAKLTLTSSGEVIWDDRETVIGAQRTSIEKLQSNGELVRQAFQSVLREAGQKMAYKIIYM